MKKEQPTIVKVIFIIASFVIPFLMTWTIFKTPGISQRYHTILTSDLNSQYVSYFFYFREILGKGINPFYAFNIGIGGNTMALLGYYLLSPINLIAFLYPVEQVSDAICLIIFVKISCAGTTCMLYFARKRGFVLSNLLFALSYAMSGYVFAYFMHLMWLDAVYALPIFVMGLEILLEEKKSAVYILSLVYAVICCYYTAYMMAGFSAIYLVFWFINNESNLKNGVERVTRYVVSSIVGLGISACVLLPVLAAQMDVGRVPEEMEGSFRHELYEILSRLFTAVYNIEMFKDGTPNIYCGMLVVTLVVLFFVTYRENVRKRIAGIWIVSAFFLSFWLTELDKVWHGFDKNRLFNHRYSFICCFVLILIAEECYSNREIVVSLVDIILTDILLALLIGYLQYCHVDSFQWYYAVFDLAAIIIASVCCYILKKGNQEINRIFLLLIIVLQTAQLYINNTVYVDVHAYDDYSAYGSYIAYSPMVEQVKELDQGFYRMDKTFSFSQNDPMMLAYNGISHFSSSSSSAVRALFTKIGYMVFYDYWQDYGKGATYAGDSLLGVKYLITYGEDEYYESKGQVNGANIYYNPYALQVGTVVSKDILNTKMEDQEAFENQERIYSGILGEQAGLFHKCETSEEEYVNVGQNDRYFYKLTDDEGYISLHFTAQDSNPIYLNMWSIHYPGLDVYVNGVHIGQNLETYNHSIMPIGHFERGEEVTVEFHITNNIYILGYEFYSLDMERFAQVSARLQEQGWQVDDWSQGRVSATVEVTCDDSCLFMTIPYDDGWTILVDNEEVEAEIVLGGLMAVPLSIGSHTIQLKFTPKGLWIGVIASLLSLAAFFVLCYIQYRTPAALTHKQQKKRTMEMIQRQRREEKKETDKETKKDLSPEEFVAIQYKGKCQMCDTTQENDLEEISLFDCSIKEQDKYEFLGWDKIYLCSNCKSQLTYYPVKMDGFLAAVRTTVAEEGAQYKFQITVNGTKKTMIYTSEHLKHLQKALERYEWSENVSETFRYK